MAMLNTQRESDRLWSHLIHWLWDFMVIQPLKGDRPVVVTLVGLLILVATPKKIEKHKLSHKYHEISLAIYFIV